MAIMKKFHQPHENSGRHYDDLRNKINKWKGYFTKEIETLELKNSINKMKNAIEIVGNRAEQVEERISELEGTKVEGIQVKKETKLRFFLTEVI